eukprot:TRINITY_DN14927_c0_g1_i1.p1 TRINITY_DN14927_c0_g1~~TRINITY_DN14927_c0_g1_i1.p1  ORF type:complete len:103 (+),score=35.21 TRINITY_DN14927_c0_g1_i1:67-375(+)
MYCVTTEGNTTHCFFFLMIRRPPRSTQSRSSAASDVYKRQPLPLPVVHSACTNPNRTLTLTLFNGEYNPNPIQYVLLCFNPRVINPNSSINPNPIPSGSPCP